jgi:hypothetical protein
VAVGDAPDQGERRSDLAHAASAWPDTEKEVAAGAEQDRPDVAQARTAWRESQPAFDPGRLIFVDETPDQVRGRLWTKTNMTKHYYGWAEVGHRLVDGVPHGH